MTSFSDYQGMSQLGRAYRIMLENGCEAPGSVVRGLVESIIRCSICNRGKK